MCVALWADNSVLATLANCFPPILLQAGNGVDRRLRDDNGMQEKEPTPVKIPLQTKSYLKTFGIIDKKNMKDKKFDLKGVSKNITGLPKSTSATSTYTYTKATRQPTTNAFACCLLPTSAF